MKILLLLSILLETTKIYVIDRPGGLPSRIAYLIDQYLVILETANRSFIAILEIDHLSFLSFLETEGQQQDDFLH